MKLAEIYRSILLENVGTEVFRDRFIQHLYELWTAWKKEFPNEPGLDKPEYMINTIEGGTLQYDVDQFEVMRKMKSSNKIIRQTKKCSKFQRACFYNSLNYMKLYDQEGIDLAWGICIDLPYLQERSAASVNQTGTRYLNYIGGGDFKGRAFIHAFLVNNKNQIIDPTLGLKYSDHTYFYDIVPKETWKSFSHKFDDEDFDARDFADGYIKTRGASEYSARNLINDCMKFMKKSK